MALALLKRPLHRAAGAPDAGWLARPASRPRQESPGGLKMSRGASLTGCVTIKEVRRRPADGRADGSRRRAPRAARRAPRAARRPPACAADPGSAAPQVMHILKALSAVPTGHGHAAARQAAADALLGALGGAATLVGIYSAPPDAGTCMLAGAAGAGAEVLRRRTVAAGQAHAACRCCRRHASSFLYRTVHSEADARALPQDWAALHREAGLRTFLAAHIVVAGQDAPAGVLVLASPEPGAFMEDSWPLLLSMVCTGLVPLLTSPWLSGLSGLAAALVDAASDGFATFAAAFLQHSGDLLAAITHRQLGVRLGLLSADGAELLLLHLASRSLAAGEEGCEVASIESSGDAEQQQQQQQQQLPSLQPHTFGEYGSFDLPSSSACPQLRITRVAAAGTLLADAARAKREVFVADACAALAAEGEEAAALDMVDVGDELVSSIAAVPLFGADGAAVGGLYVTSDKPGPFLGSNPVVVEQAALLQAMLHQQLVALPATLDALHMQACVVPEADELLSSSMASCEGVTSSATNLSLTTHGSHRPAVLQKVWELQDKQQECASEYVQELELHTVLGKGGFSTVYAGSWQGSRTAVKVMRVPHDDKLGIPIKSAMEMATLSTLRHPNIVNTYACLTDMVEERRRSRGSSGHASSGALNICFRKARPADLGDASRDTYNIVVMERCDRGNLWTAVRHGQLLHKQLPDGRLKINMRLLYTVLLDVAGALAYMHSCGVVHCDIKAENVLLHTASGRGCGFVAKLADFGLSKLLGDKGTVRNNDTAGTLSHLAPERFQTGSSVGAAVDVFSFGVLMYELYAGQKPYKGAAPGPALARAIFQGLRPQLPASTPPAYRALAEACWAGSPCARPSFTAIVQHLQVGRSCSISPDLRA
ncbi:serine/threonine-protein kinase [Scenedesmus sp. PABB004]|nr:serine/threonine-protein kinase [Scenedesmus sp. PABB004]